MTRTKVMLALACILALVAVSDGKVQKGSVKGKSGTQWVPISRFWFGASSNYPVLPTSLTYSVQGVTPTTQILIYDDQPQRWQAAYANREKYDCATLQSLANDYQKYLNSSGATYKFNETYARHWYVVLSDCNSTMDLTYELTFHNVGGKHSYQFSMDEQGLWAIFLSFFLFFMVLLVGQLIVAYMLHSSQTLFRVVQLLALSVILQFVAMMFGLIHYDQYARNGVGSPGSHFFGEMLNFVAHWLFVVMLLLIARGTNETFVLSQRKNAIIATGAFFFLDVIFWIWRTVSSNTVLSPPFIYGSAPGIIMLIIRALIGVYFVLLLRFSYIEEGNPDRRAFLFRFGIVGCVWLFFLPFIVAMTAAFLAGSLEAYAMTRTVLGFWYTVNFVVLCSFTFFFYWPSRISNFYDFSKADVMIGASSSTSPYETL